ncbi:unnamed protein product [Pedinophyceae sp. YPF-701]|nr:unnamed protein product [Pedinophyceae sp. YPF-701]
MKTNMARLRASIAGLAALALIFPAVVGGRDLRQEEEGEGAGPTTFTIASGPSASAEADFGFATGGAQDVSNFRANIKAGKLPLPTDVTFGGVVKDYFFDTSSPDQAPCQELFCPRFSYALSRPPRISPRAEGDPAVPRDLFLTVGLDSGMTAEQAARKDIDLVVVLDISGSMFSPFDRYYYDPDTGQERELTEDEARVTKMKVAVEAVVGAIEKLRGNDRLGVVLFDDDACVPKGLERLACTDVDRLKREIRRDVAASGGTDISLGYDRGTAELRGCRACSRASLAERERRILLVTDAQPNLGDTSESGLLARIRANAAEGIFTTVIGVGLDFNTELVEALVAVRGANYFSVHTPGAFKERVADRFDLIVNPLVFDLTLAVDPESVSAGWKVLAAYGTGADEEFDEGASDRPLIEIPTLFPSPKTAAGVRGGVILLRVSAPNNDGAAETPLRVTASYEDRSEQRREVTRDVPFPLDRMPDSGELYQSSGARKAVLLARYTDLLRGWLAAEWQRCGAPPATCSADDHGAWYAPAQQCATWAGGRYCENWPRDDLVRAVTKQEDQSEDECAVRSFLAVPGDGAGGPSSLCILPLPPPLVRRLGRWERQSRPLTVSDDSARALELFAPYLAAQAQAVGDPELLETERNVLSSVLQRTGAGNGDGARR